MIQPVTDLLLHDLVTRTHSEGILSLNVSALITADGRVLLLEHPDRDFDDPCYWDLPTFTVRSGEPLTDALDRGLANYRGIGLSVDEITGYLGSYDHNLDETDLIRCFAFTATTTDPGSVCRTLRTAHHWTEALDNPEVSPDVRRLLETHFANSLGWATYP